MRKGFIYLIALMIIMTLAVGCEKSDIDETSTADSCTDTISSTESEKYESDTRENVNGGSETQETVADTESKTDTTNTETETSEDILGYSYNTIIYKLSENSDVFKLSDRAGEFVVTEFIDEAVSKEIKMILFGKEQSLVYKCSAYSPFFDKRVNHYSVSGLDNGMGEKHPPEVAIDAETGEILQYSLFPYDAMPKTENECIKFVKSVVGERLDFDELSYNVKTGYLLSTENATRKIVVDGFHVCEENERLVSYNLLFTKYINGIATYNEIQASFSENTFGISIYTAAGVDDTPSRNENFVEETDREITTYIVAEIDPKYVPVKCTVIGKRLFMKDGISYILADVEVEFKTKENGEESYTTIIQTITEIQSAERQKVEN